MLYVGIDVAKSKHDISVIDSSGKIFVKHLQITNNREGFTKLQSTLTNLQKNNWRRSSNCVGRYRPLLL